MGAETDAALINMSGQLMSGALNYAAANDLNIRTRNYNKEMYQMQRADALADWNRQNEYNSPQAQMQRLKLAGLNPNLVYGGGATTTGASIRSSNADAWNPRVPSVSFDASSVLSSYYDTKIKQAQIDNLRTQNTVMVNDATLKAAVTANTLANKAATEFSTSQAKRLADNSAQVAEQNLRKLTQSIDIDRQQNERQATMQAEQIARMRLQNANTEAERRRIEQGIENLKNDSQLKSLDIQLKRTGEDRSPWYLRMLFNILRKNGIDVPNLSFGGE